MILIDFSQIVIASLVTQQKKGSVVDEALVRHVALNSLLKYKNQFKKKFGDEIIICFDTKISWRKKFWKNYKIRRKAARKESTIDWPLVFSSLELLKSEISEFLPYKVVSVDGAEADDIIGTIVAHKARTTDDKILIISSDKDFVQLQKFKNVKQWSPSANVKGKVEKGDWVSFDVSPEHYLKEHIIRGDDGDDIPNIFSSDNTFVDGIRQTSVTESRLSEYMQMDEINIIANTVYREQWLRNKKLIDLNEIPDTLQNEIMKVYESQTDKKVSKMSILNYLINRKLKLLVRHAGEF